MKTTLIKFCLVIVLGLGIISACDDDKPAPNAVITTTIVSTQVFGNADDGDSSNPADQYTGANSATDQRTKSSSGTWTATSVSGKAEAESFDPGANTVVSDVAIAKSFNKVVTQLQVTKRDSFTFDIDLDINKVKLRHDGKVKIDVKAAILDDQGVSVTNGGIANIDFEFNKDGNNPTQVIIAGDATSPEAAEANGDFNKTLSGPNRGVDLPIGTYRIEMDLRIIATAPVQIGADNLRHRAEVGSSSITIKLR